MDLIAIYSNPQNENRINIGQLCNSIYIDYKRPKSKYLKSPLLHRNPIRTLFRLRVGRQEMLKTGLDTITMTQRQFYVWSEEVRKKRDECRTGELGLDKSRERE